MRIRITLATLFLCLLPAAAHADPLVITSGQFVADGHNGVSVQVSGQNFSYSGATPHESVLPFASSPFPAGTTRSLGGTQAFTDRSSFCFGGACFSHENVTGPDFISGSITFSAGSFTFPQFGFDPPPTFIITVPFTLTGQAVGRHPNDLEPTSLQFVGEGVLTITYSTFAFGSGTHYDFRRAEANFTTPTPEPATLLLLTSGLAGAAALRRRRRRGPAPQIDAEP